MKKSLIITLIILVIGTLSLTGYLLFKNSSNETNIKEVFNNIIKKEETTSDTSSDSDTDAEYNATIGDTTVNLNTENKEEITYKIVGSTESDILAKEPKISNDSPVWNALLWKKKWETIKVKSPAWNFEYKILNIA